jgi:hypothetical protein
MPRLDSRASALRFSLLASLGLVPIACGGTTRGAPGDENAGTGAGASSNTGGSDPTAGTKAVTGKGGSNNPGGSTGKAGATGVAGTGVGGTTGTGGGTSMGGASSETRCTSPEVDPTTGLVHCEEGYSHRPIPKTCMLDDGPIGAGGEGGAGPASDPNSLPRVSGNVPCFDDYSTCDQFQYGYCDPGSGGQVPYICASGCMTDQDCGANAICLCGNQSSPTGGTCQYAACATDAECGPGNRCASFGAGCGGGYACQTANDTCTVDADCQPTEVCEPIADGSWQCTPAEVCGRPFLVESQARVAPVVASSDWLVHAI